MNLNLVLTVSVIALTLGVLVVIAYLIMILSHIRKMLKPIDQMLGEVQNEFTPLLNDMSGISSSVKNILVRFDRITRVVLGKIELIGEGTEMASSYASRFFRNPRAELDVVFAGIKKGLDVLFKKKGE